MSALETAGMLLPDVFEIGGRVYAGGGQNKDQRPHNVRSTFPKPGSGRRKQMPGSVIKQEGNSMSDTIDQDAAQVALDGELAAFVEACTTPERKAEMLVKIGFYNVELTKQADMLANVDDELAGQVAEEWFAQGDELLKRALWNARAGSEEIPLRKQAPIAPAELALAKMLDEAPNDTAKSHLLHKIGSYTTEYHNMINGLYGQPDDRIEAVVTAWLTADPSDMPLKKNILDAEMPKSGKMIYGAGVSAGDVLNEMSGNASTHAGSKLGGSETNSDSSIKRSIKTSSSGEGSGKRVGNSRGMPGQDNADSPNPGSGTAGPEGGSPNVKPTVLIRRKGTTGGLGSVAGAQNGEGVATVQNDDTNGESQWNGKGKKKAKKNGDAEKAEFITDLLKVAPEEMIEAILELDEEDQELAAGVAANHAADLLAWTNGLPGDGLAKRDVEASVADWLSEDPDQLQLKKWVTEALATAEEIPLDLAQAIIDWEPPSRVSVRREAA